jgi:DNA-binding response OmpR family regulator
MSDRVLLIDDDVAVHEIVRTYLEREGYIVYAAMTGLDGLEISRLKQPALVVLDLMLPDLSGDRVCAEIRARSDVPILMLTARSSLEERVEGFSVGADDYLVKPFSPRELVVRVKALLRRASGSQSPLGQDLSFDNGRLRIDTVRHEISIGGIAREVTPSEYKLLLALAQYPGRAYSRLELINRVQGYDFAGYERTVDAHVKNLRRKIEDDPGRPRYIQTVRGVGYRLGADPDR